MGLIEKSIEILLKALGGQVDKDNDPAVLHSLTVGLMGETSDEKVCGILHDVVEDSDWTFEDLLNEGIPSEIVNALRLLTHEKSVPYMDYVQNIIDSHNPLALKVKYHDLIHNYSRGKAHPRLQAKHGPALKLVEAAVKERSEVSLYKAPEGENIEVGIFACGCFWGVQHEFEKEPGVVRTIVGYTGDDSATPNYTEVRTHITHHVEAVAVEFDTTKTSYEQLCKVFFEMHDPAQTDGVGPDIGPQYRSCIFYRNESQHDTAEQVIDILKEKGYEVNTLLLPEQKFWTGEEYHQHYYEQTGGVPYCHIREKKF